MFAQCTATLITHAALDYQVGNGSIVRLGAIHARWWVSDDSVGDGGGSGDCSGHSIIICPDELFVRDGELFVPHIRGSRWRRWRRRGGKLDGGLRWRLDLLGVDGIIVGPDQMGVRDVVLRHVHDGWRWRRRGGMLDDRVHRILDLLGDLQNWSLRVVA